MSPVAAVERSTTWLGAVAVFTLALVPLVGYLAPLGFAPLLALAGLLATPGLARARPPVLPALALLLLVLWALVSLAWSPGAPKLAALRDTGDVESFTALKLLMQLALYGSAVAALGQMSALWSRRAGTVMVVGFMALALIAALDGISGASFYQWLRAAIDDPIRPDLAVVKVSMATYALVLLLWPSARIMSSRGWTPAIYGLIAAILVGSVSLGADASWAALLCGAGAWLAVHRLGKLAAKALVVAVAAPFALAPVVLIWGVNSGLFAQLHRHVPRSWDARLDIWAFSTLHIQEHPFRGLGLDASRTFGLAIPLHTHNAAVQIWLELGAVGAALAGIFFSWIAYRIVAMTERSREDGAMAAAALTTYLVIGGLSFGVWQEWWLALGALTVIACGLARGLKSPPRLR